MIVIGGKFQVNCDKFFSILNIKIIILNYEI